MQGSPCYIKVLWLPVILHCRLHWKEGRVKIIYLTYGTIKAPSPVTHIPYCRLTFHRNQINSSAKSLTGQKVSKIFYQEPAKPASSQCTKDGSESEGSITYPLLRPGRNCKPCAPHPSSSLYSPQVPAPLKIISSIR